MKPKKLKAVIVGAGHRALTYAAYAEACPDELDIVGVAEPSDRRRAQTAARYGLPPKACFRTAEELAAVPRFANFVINGTMDHQHVATSLPLINAGYHLLLEKPFATSEEEMRRLLTAAREHQRHVAICHVLRYAPFYARIRQCILDDAIGDLLNVQATEHVSYHHMVVGYVRGKWNRKRYCNTSMLMAKSCHDLDLIAWMKSGVDPVRVASMGNNFQFRPERAPAGAGTRCLIDCPIESECLYSARKHYLDHPNRWGFYVWDSIEHIDNPTLDDKTESLRTTNPYGRCVWKCDNDVVDHQSVVIEFSDGCTATLNMIGGCAKPSRSIHLIGTRGEIQGCLEDSRFVIRAIDPRPGHEYAETAVDVSERGDMTGAFGGHGGGDLRLIGDFLRVLAGEQPSISSTGIEDSVCGHLIGFRADQAMEAKRGIPIDFHAWRNASEPRHNNAPATDTSSKS